MSTDDATATKGGAGNPLSGSNSNSASAGSKDPTFGSNPSVKTLYEGRTSGDSYIDWNDYPPKQMSKSAARAQDRVAIKLYKVKDKDKPVISGRFALKHHMIEVQNPQLVAALEPILKKEDFHLDVNEAATFTEPFRPLFFCYDDIVAKHRSLADDDGLKPFMLLLIKVLDEVFSDIRTKTRALKEKGLVSFKTAWTYFPRDSVVISWGHNCELLCKVVDTYVKKGPMGVIALVVRCKVLRFNGEAFIWEDSQLEIPPFAGNRPILELPHYPLEFHREPEEVKARMVARGKRVLEYQGLTYCCYTGLGICQSVQDPKKVEKHNVDGRILIDVVGYKKHHLSQGAREEKDPQTKKNTVRGTGRVMSSEAPAKGFPDKRLTDEEQQKNREVMLKDESKLMFIFPLLEGYALKNKVWLSFYIEDIKPMVWNDQAFEHLVYDEQQKDLVLSFVENHGQTAPKSLDVIVGKGQGLIILLSGPPGTGKTLTAEAVADKTHRPLFYLQAEDLGINAATLGANIKVVFQMATEWDAVILLDEADVFMAERHPQDIARNELVSIFLRELEYFRGIIFLTTNLYDTIDTAFRSRVSLHLLFKPLTADARLVVWRKFLDRLPKKGKVIEELPEGEGEGQEAESSGPETVTPAVKGSAPVKKTPPTPTIKGGELIAVKRDDNNTMTEDGHEDEHDHEQLSEDDLKELAAWHLNGREIKNAVRMVRSWCDHKGYEMTLSRLENGIKVTSPHAGKHTHENDTSLYDT